MVKGVNGPKPHGLLATERGARQQMLAALRKLGIELHE
jgi:hypothetical protein